MPPTEVLAARSATKLWNNRTVHAVVIASDLQRGLLSPAARNVLDPMFGAAKTVTDANAPSPRLDCYLTESFTVNLANSTRGIRLIAPYVGSLPTI
jgi:hypothetical protein